MLPEYIVKYLQEIAKSEGFTDYEYETKAGSSHGDNLVGVLIAVTISGQNDNIKPKNLHLVCKTQPCNERQREVFKTDLLFEREIYVYSKVLPAFVRFQQQKGLTESESFLSFPKTYASEFNEENDTYILIMEDLRPKQYKMWPKKDVIGIDHELLIMQELGKFHAISFAMKDQEPNEFEQFQHLNDTWLEISFRGKLRTHMNQVVERGASVLKNPKHKLFMKNVRNTFADTMEEFLAGASSKEFAVVGHGDCWINNVLFLNDIINGNELPKSICFLDWQISRYAPPVLDLLYHIYGSTDGTFREKYYEIILLTYYASLSETIRKLGSDPDKLYTFENFQAQMKKFSEYGLVCGAMITLINLSSAENVRNLDEYAELLDRGEEPELINHFDGATHEEYSKIINELFIDLVNNGMEIDKMDKLKIV